MQADEYSKDLEATKARNDPPVTIELTAMEVFAVVNAVRFAETIIPPSSPLGDVARLVAKKMHDSLDSNSLLSQHLTVWDEDISANFSSGNFPPEDLLEGFID
jgi:hypothetical protein